MHKDQLISMKRESTSVVLTVLKGKREKYRMEYSLVTALKNS